MRRAAALAVALACLMVGARPGGAHASSTGPPDRPAITVSGAWGGGSPASWSDYTAVARNVGTEVFRGELAIVPVEGDDPTRGPVAAGPHGGPGPATPDVSPLIGAARYVAPLTLAPGEERTVSTLLVVSPLSYRAEVRDLAGRAVASTAPLPLAPTTSDRVAVLSAAAPERAFLPSGAGASMAESGRFGSARDFPATPARLRGVDAVVIADFDSATLSREQLDAMRSFLQLGGSLVVAGGAAWERTVRPLPEDLAPLRPTATAVASLAPVADLAAVAGDAAVTVATGEIVGGRSVLEGPEQIPLLVEKEYGAGRIVQLAFDPLVDVAAPASRTLATLARDYALARAGIGVSSVSGQGAATGGEGVLALLDGPKREGVALSPIALALVLYALLVGPVAYGALRWRRRASRLWSVAPALAVGLAAASWLASLGPVQRAPVASQLQVQHQAPDGTLQVDSWHRLLPATSGDADITLGAGVLGWVVPRAADQPMGLPPLVSSLVADQPVGGDDGTSTVREDRSTRVKLDRWPVWAPRTVRTSDVAHAAVTLEADLRAEGATVVGRIANRSGAPVRDLRVQAPNGRRAEVTPLLAPGQTVEVNVTLSPAPPSSAPGSATTLLDRAGDRPGATAGELDLVGLVPPRPVLRVGGATPRTRATAVLVATIRLQTADTVATSLGRARQVCCGPGGAQVYEVELPPGRAAALAVAAQPATDAPPADAIEAYSWPTHTWRPLPGAVGLPGPATLEPGELSAGGVVRLRIRDATTVKTLAVVPSTP